MILVAGSTGYVGGEVCQLLLDRGQPVRALVRPASDPARIAHLRQLGADVVQGDLLDAASLADACDGVHAVVSTATAAAPGRPADGVVTVDGEGQQALVSAAEQAGADHFVHVSFSGNLQVPTPFHASKRSVEQRLQQSSMAWTVLRPSAFMEIWLAPFSGFDVANGQITIFGSGSAPISYISFADVAAFCVEALTNPAARNRVIDLGGPDALTPLQVVKLAESVVGRPMAVQHVPAEALQAQLDAAPDPLQQSFAGLMLALSMGDAIDMDATLAEFPLQLRSVRSHIEQTWGGGADQATVPERA